MDPVVTTVTTLPPDETPTPSSAPAAPESPPAPATPPAQPAAAVATGKGEAEAGGTSTAEDTRTPLERRLDEVLNTEDLSTLKKPVTVADVLKHPEQLPAGWTRGLDGKLKNDKGQFATLPSETPEAPAEVAPAPKFKLTFPGRGPTDTAEEFELDEQLLEQAGIPADRRQKILEANNRLVAGYARREDLRTERATVEEGQRYLDSIITQLQDPKTSADFVLERMPPAVHAQLIERVLATLPADTFEAILEKAMKWDRTPLERRTAAVEEENRRLKAADQRQRAHTEQNAGMQEANAIADAIVELIPHDWTPRRREAAFNAAINGVMSYADKHSLDRLDPSKVRDVLDGIGVLEALGLTAPAAGQPPAPPNGRAGSEAPTPAQITRAQKVGDELRDRQEKRKNVAAVATGGLGGVSTAARPPRGAHKTLEERLAWLNSQS